MTNILNLNVSVIDLDAAVLEVFRMASAGSGAYVCLSNVHMCMEVYDAVDFENIVNSADLVLPDGRPLSWGLRFLGHKTARQVRGLDMVNRVCEESIVKNLKIGFYGGSSESLLETVKLNLLKSYPGLNISYSYSPPFRPLTTLEDQEVISEIKRSGVNILFVGIGCPKQERWMAEHKSELPCVMLGVGAAFDFIAGRKKHAPRWVQKIGFEWLFRLCCEPIRLWKRYLKQNPRFVWHFLKQLIKHKLSLKS